MVQNGFFKGVSSLSELCSAGNVDALLDYISGLYDIWLVSESEFSSGKSIIVSSSIQTRSSFLIAPLLHSVSSDPSLASFIICLTFEAS